MKRVKALKLVDSDNQPQHIVDSHFTDTENELFPSIHWRLPQPRAFHSYRFVTPCFTTFPQQIVQKSGPWRGRQWDGGCGWGGTQSLNVKQSCKFTACSTKERVCSWAVVEAWEQSAASKWVLVLGSKSVIKRWGSSVQFLFFSHIQSCQWRVSSTYEIFNSRRFWIYMFFLFFFLFCVWDGRRLWIKD